MSFTMNIKITPEHPGDNLEAFLTWMQNEAFPIIHRAACFKVLETIVAWHREYTGEARAGWLSYMAAYGHPYYRSLTPAIDKGKDQTQEGMGKGSYSEGNLVTSIINNVPYIGFVDDQEGIFDMSGKESYLQALYPSLRASYGRLAELYSYGWEVGLNTLPEIYALGYASSNFDTSSIPTDLGIPTNAEAAN